LPSGLLVGPAGLEASDDSGGGNSSLHASGLAGSHGSQHGAGQPVPGQPGVFMCSPGFDGQAGCGEAAADQVRPVLDLLQLALDDADQAVQAGGGEVGHRALEQRPDALRFHDLRHGAASMLLAAGVEPRVISQMLGHATVAFTMDVYTEVAEELAEAAAAAIAAYIPRRGQPEIHS